MLGRQSTKEFLKRVARTDERQRKREPKEITDSERLRLKAAAQRERADDLRKKADELERDARAFEDAAAILERRARQPNPPRDQSDAPGRDRTGLKKRDQPSNVTSVTTLEHGLAVSQGRASDPLTRAANAVGMTVKSLAAAVSKRVGRPVARSGISMARQGLRPIRQDIVDAIRDLTRSEKFPKGFEVNKQNWPGEIVP